MVRHLKFSPTLIIPSPGLITPFLVNALPNILAANVLSDIGRNPLFCSFVSFLIVSLISFINNPDSESAKLRAVRTKKVLTCKRALRAYMLTSQQALSAYVLTCQPVLRAYVLMCQHALCAYVFNCQRVLRAHLLTYQRALCAHVLACSRAHVSMCLACLHAYVPTC